MIELVDLTGESGEVEQARFDQGDEGVDVLEPAISLTTAKAAINA